ncbi:glutamate-1-semialdehyde 2,1-aminomutase [Bacillus sp. Bva_UNVM-123]|uniref:glutamate-1-semialdehyde 2,1-aminomutase n=1 Tax=Bacillus sp. Bva_UNVM-123 TaxID=2829798 RepID=UPI00391F71D4
MLRQNNSKYAYQKAKALLPGGVNSPVRSFNAIGISPIFIERGKGSKIYDIDGNEYIDYILSWGPLIHGHSDNDVNHGLKEMIECGTSFGLSTLQEIQLAELVMERIPSIEKVRMVNSGTEATMSALRLARGYTGRKLIVKFEGCYHGHSDHLLVKAGSGVATLGLPDSPGVPKEITQNTISIPYNDFELLRETFHIHGQSIAAVIIEPFAGNMAGIPAERDFLLELRLLTNQYGALLIFDEVMTGFRLDYHSAQGYYGILPDLTCLGKIIGGGLPVGGYGGKKEIMNLIAPEGPIYQAGTLSGNPLAMLAGYITINKLNSSSYEYLKVIASKLLLGLSKAANKYHIPHTINQVGTMIGFSFTNNPLKNFNDAKNIHIDLFKRFYIEMLNQGILLPPSQYECFFVSTAHTNEDIDQTIHAAEKAFEIISNAMN